MANTVIAGAPSREPQQGRSKASFERMVNAAEKLMIRKGSDDFTLTEVSKVGKVSIGSIYLRFNSKEDLLRAVQSRELGRLEVEQDVMLTSVQAGSETLAEFMRGFVEGFGELLRAHAEVLRPIMLRAAHDQALSGSGKESADRFARAARKAMLTYRHEFGGDDPERKAGAAYRVIYATIARYLGLGSTSEAADEGGWDELKRDLGAMCAAFLRSPD